MLKNRLTLTIHTCEKYSDLWDGHIKLLDSNWEERNLRTIIVTDEATDKSYDGIEIFSAGDAVQLPQRIKKVLNQINTEYILMTLDDYYPIYKISNKKIERLLDIMDNLKLDYIRLFPIPKAKKRIREYNNLFEIELNEEYDVNLYPGIWRKSFLYNTIRESIDPWKYEVTLTKIAKQLNAKCALSTGREFEILDVVRKGKLLRKASKYLKTNNLYHGNRPVNTYITELSLLIKGWGKWICPKPLRRYVKAILKMFGVHFYSDDI